jgi:hypothetical protein
MQQTKQPGRGVVWSVVVRGQGVVSVTPWRAVVVLLLGVLVAAGGRAQVPSSVVVGEPDGGLVAPGLYLRLDVVVGRVDDSYEQELPFVLEQVASLVHEFPVQCVRFVGEEVPPPVALVGYRIARVPGARVAPCAGAQTPTLLGPVPSVAASFAALHRGDMARWVHEVVVGAVDPVRRSELRRVVVAPWPRVLPASGVLAAAVRGYFAVAMARRLPTARIPVVSVSGIARAAQPGVVVARVQCDEETLTWRFVYATGSWRVLENDQD